MVACCHRTWKITFCLINLLDHRLSCNVLLIFYTYLRFLLLLFFISRNLIEDFGFKLKTIRKSNLIILSLTVELDFTDYSLYFLSKKNCFKPIEISRVFFLLCFWYHKVLFLIQIMNTKRKMNYNVFRSRLKSNPRDLGLFKTY